MDGIIRKMLSAIDIDVDMVNEHNLVVFNLFDDIYDKIKIMFDILLITSLNLDIIYLD